MVRIGLEIHTQLTTETKLYCGCPNKFTREPNSYVCETCLGFPGSKPRVNKKAIEYGIKIGLALNCKFPKETFFSRKSYFYPDMSKNFQISQYEIPLAREGYLIIDGKRIRISRINLEEDPARIVHVGTITAAKHVLVDYNRSGVPLCEIVTGPDFSSPDEARKFLQELSSILEYLGVYDSAIEGSLRVDANISIDSARVEIKNISGFKDVEKALNYEIIRQRNLLRRGEKIIRETRSWDADAGITRSLRLKEEEEEYGYIYEGDLPRITLTREKIEEIKKTIPELATEKIKRYQTMGITKDLAIAITIEPEIAKIFEDVAKEINPKLAASFIAGELKKSLNYRNLRLKETELKAWHLIKLLKMVENKVITEKGAELLLRDLILKPRDPEELLKAKELTRISDEKQLEKIVDEVFAENAKAVVDYRSGRSEAFEFLVGQTMRKTHGRGDPTVIRNILKRKLTRE